VCISPAMVAKVFDGSGIHPTLTIGGTNEFSQKIEKMGSKHQECPTRDCVVDRENKIISGPAYMTGQNIAEVADGIAKAVQELVRML